MIRRSAAGDGKGGSVIVDQGKTKCAHDGCKCQVPPGQMYCSAHCAQAAGDKTRGDEHCGCGHQDCKSSMQSSMS